MPQHVAEGMEVKEKNLRVLLIIFAKQSQVGSGTSRNSVNLSSILNQTIS